jgi:MFS transporter, DHA1 family, inner membrane transport protein
MGLMGLFVIGNLVSGVASNFQIMMGGRIVSALCHGAYFGIGAVVASDLVEKNQKARAISVMFAGLTVANVLGVPFGTAIGQNYGWRTTFLCISGIGIAAVIGIFLLVPIDNPEHHLNVPRTIRQELYAFKQRQVWFSLLITICGFGGLFGGFTYIAYTLTRITRFADSTVPFVLFLFGIGVFAGNYIGSKSADKNPKATISGYLAALFFTLIIFALTATNKPVTIICIVLMGIFGFAPAAAVQMRVMRYASRAPTLVSGANIAAFNIGNTLGAGFGGILISHQLGYASPLWSAAALTGTALVIFYFAELDERNTARHLKNL